MEVLRFTNKILLGIYINIYCESMIKCLFLAAGQPYGNYTFPNFMGLLSEVENSSFFFRKFDIVFMYLEHTLRTFNVYMSYFGGIIWSGEDKRLMTVMNVTVWIYKGCDSSTNAFTVGGLMQLVFGTFCK